MYDFHVTYTHVYPHFRHRFVSSSLPGLLTRGNGQPGSLNAVICTSMMLACDITSCHVIMNFSSLSIARRRGYVRHIDGHEVLDPLNPTYSMPRMRCLPPPPFPPRISLSPPSTPLLPRLPIVAYKSTGQVSVERFGDFCIVYSYSRIAHRKSESKNRPSLRSACRLWRKSGMRL